MATLSSGQSVTLTLTDNDSVTVQTAGVVVVEAVSGLGVTAGKIAEITGSQTFGPYQAGSIKLTASVKDAYYETADGRRTDNQLIILAQSGVASSVTGTTAETTLATVTIPAGTMGLHSRLEISPFFAFSGAAGAKAVRISVGGNTIHSVSGLAAATSHIQGLHVLRNRGSLNSQIASQVAAANPYASSSTAPVTSAIDFSQDQQIVFYATLASAADTATLSHYTVEVK